MLRTDTSRGDVEFGRLIVVFFTEKFSIKVVDISVSKLYDRGSFEYKCYSEAKNKQLRKTTPQKTTTTRRWLFFFAVIVVFEP